MKKAVPSQLFGANADYIFLRKDGHPLDEHTLEKLYNLVNTFQFPASLTEFNQSHIMTLPIESQALLKSNEYTFFNKMIAENFPEQDIVIAPIPKTLVQFSWFVASLSKPMFSYGYQHSFLGDRTVEEFEKLYSEKNSTELEDLSKKIDELTQTINDQKNDFQKEIASILQEYVEEIIEECTENNLSSEEYILWLNNNHSVESIVPDNFPKPVERALKRCLRYICRKKKCYDKDLDVLEKQKLDLEKQKLERLNIMSRGQSSHSDYNLSFISEEDKFKLWKEFNAFFSDLVFKFNQQYNGSYDFDHEEYLTKLVDYVFDHAKRCYENIPKECDMPYNFRSVIFPHEKIDYALLDSVIQHELTTSWSGNLHTIYSANECEIPNALDKKNANKGLSYSDGYFAAPFFDNINGMAASYLKKYSFVDVVDLEKEKFFDDEALEVEQKLFFIPPIITCFRMLGTGEYHHPRSKISKNDGLLWLHKQVTPEGMRTGISMRNGRYSKEMVSSIEDKDDLNALFYAYHREKMAIGYISQLDVETVRKNKRPV